MTVTIRVAGAQVPIDAEIELCGMWS